MQLVYVWLSSADLCIQRVQARSRSGGHSIEDAVIRRRYERSLVNFFSLYRPLADDWQVYDNAGGDKARPIAEGRLSQVTAIFDRAVWDEMMRRDSP
jgi:predicted ABC-type ATPase